VFSLNPSQGSAVSSTVSAIPSTEPTITSPFTNVSTNTDVQGNDVAPAETPSFFPTHPIEPTLGLGDDIYSASTPGTTNLKTPSPDILSAEQVPFIEPTVENSETLAHALELGVPKVVEDSASHDVAMPKPSPKRPLVRVSQFRRMKISFTLRQVLLLKNPL